MFEVVLRHGHALRGNQDVGFTARKLGLHFCALKRRDCPGGNLRFDAAKVLARQIKIGNLVLLVAQGEDQIPVGALHLRNDVYGATAKICVGLFKAFALNAYLPPIVVNRAVAQQGLCKGDAHAGGIDGAKLIDA